MTGRARAGRRSAGHTRASTRDARDVVERHLAATRTIAARDRPTSSSGRRTSSTCARSPSSVELGEIAAEAARLDVPIAVGITEDVPDRTERFLNAQVIVTPAGEVTSRFDKVQRVPFGEYVPLRGLLEALGAPVDQIPTDAVAGTGPAVLDLPDGTRLAVVISWEVFFGDRARDGVDSGGALLLNPTNGSSYTGHDPADAADRVVAAARRRDRTVGRAGVADRVQRVRRRRTATCSTAPRSGEQQVIIRERAAARRHAPGTRRWATGRSRSLIGVVARRVDPGAVARTPSPTSTAVIQSTPSRLRRDDLDQDRDRAVVDERDLHVGAEAAGLDRARRGARRCSTTASTSGSACSGRAAAIQLGRRPPDVSP